MAYDSPQFQVTSEIRDTVTSAASASIKKYYVFCEARLKAVHALITVAGTNASAAIDVYAGTASVGSLACGTSTAGSIVHSGTIDTVVPANSYIELKGAANSATLAAALSIETKRTVDSVATA